MDRTIVYAGAIPLDSDILNIQRNAMIGLGALAQATLGSTAVVDGLVGTQDAVPSLKVIIGPGSITELGSVDSAAFGSLPSDSAPLVRMGVNTYYTWDTLVAPTVAGQSRNYLIEASLLEDDADPVVLPYYNAANPAVPYTGPANSGTSQNTTRQQRVSLQFKAGTAATTGTQTTPALDSGWVPLYVVTVAYGQTTITTAQIVAHPSAPFVDSVQTGRGIRSGRLIGVQKFDTAGTYTYTPTLGTKACYVRVVGAGGSGGGAGATAAAQLAVSGGGSGGGTSEGYYPVATLTGQTITVGAGGAPASGTGNAGGTSSIGGVLSATGGGGGASSTTAAPPTCAASGDGGVGVGGNVYNGKGQPGGPGLGIAVSNCCAGAGGGSTVSSGVVGPFSATATGNPGVGPGCGSSGAISQNGGAAKASGYAMSGIVIIEEYS